MRLAVVTVCALASIAVTSSTACFDASFPKGATLLCRNDGECPAGTCDLGSHTCVTAGARTSGPIATKATFTPAFAKDGDRVVLDVATDEPVAVAPAPVLTFDGETSDPGFVLEAPDGGAHAVFTLDVTPAVAERFYTLASIKLADAEAHVATSPIDAVLDVDRTPPVFGAPLVDDGNGGAQFADVAPFDVVRVRFTSSEPLDAEALSGTVGAEPLACVPSTDSAYACEASLDQASDGANTIAITGHDRAGNAATFSTSIAVDASAPFIVPGSVSVAVNGRDDFVAVTTGDTVEVELLVSETLAAPPALTLGGAGTSALPFSIDAVDPQGNFYVAHVVVGAVAIDAVEPVVVTMTDVFGHESANVVVPLPPPHDAGLDVVAVPPSPCVVPAEPPATTTCTDFDGDGFFGPSDGCAPDPVDCDDSDPTVFPGAPELPGDHKDDGCTGLGDAPVDDAHVVFTDPNVVDPFPDGTRAHPFGAFEEATTLAASTGRVVFCATGTFARSDDAVLTAPFAGGYDATTWTRDAGGARTLFTLDGGVVDVAGGYVSGIDVVGQIVDESTTLLVDVVAHNGVSVGHPITIVGSTITGSANGDLFLFGAADGSRVLRSTVGEMFPASANLLFDRIVGGLLDVQAGGDVTVSNSVLVGDGHVVATCDGCASLVIVHSNLRGESVDGTVVDIESGPNTRVTIASDNIATKDEAPVFFKQEAGTLFVFDDVMQAPNSALVEVGGIGDVDDLATFETCQWAGCGAASGNRVAELDLAQDQIHLAADVSAGNPSIHGGSPHPRFFGFPTTVAGDFDLQCRYTGAVADVGPDEK